VKCKKCEKADEKQAETTKLDEIKDLVSQSVSKFSDFNGSKDATQPIVQDNSKLSSMEIIGMIGAIGLIGLTFIIVSKNLTK
jgi:hypothetical protein